MLEIISDLAFHIQFHKRLFPNVLSTHTVSLRTLIPTGYLISRFLFNYKKGGGDLRFDELQNLLKIF